MQVQNFLDRYQQGERNFAHVDLSGASLTGANLRNINLTGANLTGANLSWSSLSHAKLTGACLHQANLHNAILNNTDFHQATLSRTQLTKVDLRWATLQEADLNWVDLTGADLSGANLQKARLNQANLEQANFNNALLNSAELIAANLRNARLIGANLTDANLWEACLEQASLREAILVGANLTEANLNAVYLRGANLSKADLHRAILTGADLSEANFEQADLSRTNLTGAYLLRASLRKADLLRAVLQDVYLLRTDLSEANLRGADLRRADLSGAYLKDTILSEANLSDTFLLESYLIRTQLDRAELTGCCIYGWHLEDIDLSQVECRYLFTKFDYASKSPSDRYPPVGNLPPGQLSRENTTESLTVEVRFQDAPNWEVVVFAIAQVQLECPNLQLTLKSYQVSGKQYVLRLSVNRLVNTKLLSQRILELYPELLRRFAAQRPTILKLLKIGENIESVKKLPSRSPIASPAPGSIVARRQQNYREVMNQIQKIILSQPPELLVNNVQQRLEFLQKQNLLTEEIQKKVICQAIIKRAKNDELFINQLLQWEKTASELARFSLLRQAIRLAIALLRSDTDSPK